MELFQGAHLSVGVYGACGETCQDAVQVAIYPEHDQNSRPVRRALLCSCIRVSERGAYIVLDFSDYNDLRCCRSIY